MTEPAPKTKRKRAAKKQISKADPEEIQPAVEENIETETPSPEEESTDSNPAHELDAQGRVIWKSLIPKEFIVPNRERLDRDGKDLSVMTKEEINNLEEKYQLILLQGFKELADIRGYDSLEESCQYDPGSIKTEKAVATCKIVWSPHEDTNNRSVTVKTVGEAHYFNTMNFGQQYLVRMAANRAFIANVRHFLRIPILGSDELGGDSGGNGNPASGPQLWNSVKDMYESQGHKFEDLKDKLYNIYPETKGATSFQDLAKWPEVLKFMVESLKKPKK